MLLSFLYCYQIQLEGTAAFVSFFCALMAIGSCPTICVCRTYCTRCPRPLAASSPCQDRTAAKGKAGKPRKAGNWVETGWTVDTEHYHTMTWHGYKNLFFLQMGLLEMHIACWRSQNIIRFIYDWIYSRIKVQRSSTTSQTFCCCCKCLLWWEIRQL